MDRRERWKLATHLNVYQLSLLMAGYDPAELNTSSTQYWSDEVVKETVPFLNAIMNAVLENRIRYSKVSDESGISWDETRIELESVGEWLISRNYRDGFFITAAAETDPLFEANSEFYAPKLAAAVRAWNEVTADPDALNGNTPKRALAIWLKKHAAEYGLLDKEGNPIKQALDDICKVANWRPEGGASPTPMRRVAGNERTLDDAVPRVGRNSLPMKPTHPPLHENLPTSPGTSDLDDEIPF